MYRNMKGNAILEPVDDQLVEENTNDLKICSIFSTER